MSDLSDLPVGAEHLRVPPHSLEVEQCLLGAILMDNAALDSAIDAAKIGPDAFYSLAHRAIWGAMTALISAGQPADVVTVFTALGDAAKDVGGLAYINALAQCVTGSANVRQYARIVSDKATLRRYIAAGDRISAAAFTAADPRPVIELAWAELAKLESSRQRLAPKAVGELLVNAIDRYTARAEGSQEAGIRTGIGHLDRFLAPGLKPGKVVCIAARPSVGKSSLSRSIGIRVARAGRTVLVLSQEMPQDEQADCVVAELGGIDSERLQTGKLSDQDWTRLVEAVEEAGSMPLQFDEQGALTLADIRAKARACRGLSLLVVDYLQLCASTLRNATTNDQVAEISKGLKALALELRIPVIVLSQLNREVEKRADKTPTLADLRDSGAIEQDVDVALLLWTAAENEETSVRTVGVNVAKNRGGRKGRFALRFDAPVYGWSDSEFPERPNGHGKRRADL